ncbi:MAG: DUF962 domain-containing protein [Alphaproteobacteria bacterium]|nr:DUF962 domain-containing protein [Alphaproteobacteria bacterium]
MAGGNRPIETFDDFWLFYLREHAKPQTRALHYAGTGLAVICLLAAITLRDSWMALGALVAGYGPAWVAHFFVEKNRPATFTHPLWSLASDFRMAFRWVCGRIGDDLERAGAIERR